MPEMIDPLREFDPLVAKLCPTQPRRRVDVDTSSPSAPEPAVRPGESDPDPAADPAQRERAVPDRARTAAAPIIPPAIDV